MSFPVAHYGGLSFPVAHYGGHPYEAMGKFTSELGCTWCKGTFGTLVDI